MKSLAPALLMTVALACPAQERLDPAALMAVQREAMAKLVIEGRGYEPDGRTTFNALGIISYDVAKGVYTMRSYAMGDAGDFPVTLTADGFTWSIPAGPTTIRYNAVVKDGTWTEVGDRTVPGKDPARFFEMRLTRIGASDWPGVGAIAPQ